MNKIMWDGNEFPIIIKGEYNPILYNELFCTNVRYKISAGLGGFSVSGTGTIVCGAGGNTRELCIVTNDRDVGKHCDIRVSSCEIRDIINMDIYVIGKKCPNWSVDRQPFDEKTVEEPVEEGNSFAKTVSKIKPLKITKRVLIEKTGSQRVIIANGNNGLIDEMRQAARKVGEYNSPNTYHDPTFSICYVNDFKDPSKYIARDLTDYRYTNHGTIEFNNVGARSYMRVTVDMNDKDLIGKCAVFDNKDGEPVVVEFDRFITCKDTYDFRFNKIDEHKGQILPGIKRFIWGKLKYYPGGFYHEKLGMLGVDPIRSDRIKFRAASGFDYGETFTVQDILRMPEFEFECHDCACCELVPLELAYLKEE